MLAGQIDRDEDRLAVGHGVAPGGGLGARLFDHPIADRDDQPAALGHADELGWFEQPAGPVLPAKKRLDPDDPLIFDRHDRLVKEHQLVALERPPEVVLDPDPLEHPRVHTVVEHLDRIGVVGLRPVHGGVGVLEQIGRACFLAFVEQRDARTDAHSVLVVADHERPAARGGKALGDPDRRVLVDEVLAEHHELVATEPGDRVSGADGGAQSRRQLAQQQVTDVVPAGVVDELEIIEIEEQDRDPGSRPPGPRERVLQPVQEQGAVRQAGQRIVAGLVDQLLGGEVALGHVPDRGQRQPAVDCLRLADGSLDGELGAVLAPGDQVELAPAHRLAVPRLRPGGTEQHVVDADARQLIRGVAEEVLGLRVDEHDPTRGVERHECARRALEQGAEAVFVNAGGGRARSAAQAQLGGGRVQRGI